MATNNGMAGSMRGFGVVQPIYACEATSTGLPSSLGSTQPSCAARTACNGGPLDLQSAPGPAGPCRRAGGGLRCDPDRPPGQPVGATAGVALLVRRISAGAWRSPRPPRTPAFQKGAPVNTTAMITLQDGVATVHCAAVEVGQGLVTISARSCNRPSAYPTCGSPARTP